MSDTVFETRPPVRLAWRRPRSVVSLFGSETEAAPPVETGDPAGDIKLAGATALLGRLLGPLLKLTIGAAVLFAGVALVVGALHNLTAMMPTAPMSPVAPWRDIVKPVRIYNLEAPAFAGTPVDYSARAHTTGGGREDVLAIGTLGGDKVAIRLRIFRRVSETPATIPLFAALAHEAAQVGLSVGRSGLPDLLPTRFGRFEFAEVSLARRDGAATPCGGFRLALDDPRLSISGLACGGRDVALTRAAIGCLIERLDVASARDDRDLIDFFARSELRRNAACAGMRLGPDGLHAPWLDDATAAGRPETSAPRDDKPVTIRKRLRRR